MRLCPPADGEVPPSAHGMGMYARAVENAGVRLRELRLEEWEDFGLALLALALSLVATQRAPTFAFPLFIGGLATLALGMRAPGGAGISSTNSATTATRTSSPRSSRGRRERRRCGGAGASRSCFAIGSASRERLAPRRPRGRRPVARLRARGRSARARARGGSDVHEARQRPRVEPAPQSRRARGRAQITHPPDQGRTPAAARKLLQPMGRGFSVLMNDPHCRRQRSPPPGSTRFPRRTSRARPRRWAWRRRACRGSTCSCSPCSQAPSSPSVRSSRRRSRPATVSRMG